MICDHCGKPIMNGSYTVKGKHYHDACYAEVFEGDGKPREVKS